MNIFTKHNFLKLIVFFFLQGLWLFTYGLSLVRNMGTPGTYPALEVESLSKNVESSVLDKYPIVLSFNVSTRLKDGEIKYLSNACKGLIIKKDYGRFKTRLIAPTACLKPLYNQVATNMVRNKQYELNVIGISRNDEIGNMSKVNLVIEDGQVFSKLITRVVARLTGIEVKVMPSYMQSLPSNYLYGFGLDYNKEMASSIVGANRLIVFGSNTYASSPSNPGEINYIEYSGGWKLRWQECREGYRSYLLSTYWKRAWLSADGTTPTTLSGSELSWSLDRGDLGAPIFIEDVGVPHLLGIVIGSSPMTSGKTAVVVSWLFPSEYEDYGLAFGSNAVINFPEAKKRCVIF